MCCFSGDEEIVVRGTNIFARVHPSGEQALIYQMNINAPSTVAMVLPIPIRAGGRFRFYDLSSYPTIFADLLSLFPRPRSKGGDLDLLDGGDDEVLAVERVGVFEASWVPSRKDFSRIDRRFRLRDDVWTALPSYDGWGFAVFQLTAGSHNVHPMAFAWETQFASRAFFPTVHVHDGKVHAQAWFDHTLFLQVSPSHTSPAWTASRAPADTVVDTTRAQGLVGGRQRVYTTLLSGQKDNSDTWVELSGASS